MNESSLDYPVIYDARDSIFMDIPRRQVHLYGKAHVKTPEMKMDAGYIVIDLKKSEILATYELDKDSNRVDLPQFSDGTEKMQASSVRYNFKTKKGYIQEVRVQQGENHLFMEVAKRHSNEELHFRRGRFTTCNLDEPHYHFHLTKAVLVPKKRIVSSVMNLWVGGAPTPLALPFSIIPQAKERNSGLLFPQIIPASYNGFGIQDIGYYLPINDQIQMSFYGSIFSSGSWGLRTQIDYAKRYKFRGDLGINFNQTRTGFPDYGLNNKLEIRWAHNKAPKSNPYWGFNSNVNFVSDNNNQNNIDPIHKNYFTNTLFSDINLRRFFPGKPITMGMKIGLRQNSKTKNITVNLPIIDINVTRIFPFKKLIKGRQKWKRPFQQIGLTYSFQGTNRGSFGDSLIKHFDIDEIGKTFQNGVRQTVNLQTTIGLIKNTIKINPAISYTNFMNFQQIERTYNPSDSTINTNDQLKFGMAHNLNFSASLTTNVYTYYRFVGKSKPIIRHLMTPSISFRYTPNLSSPHVRSYETLTDTLEYSTFERSVYPVGVSRDQGVISFGLNNNIQLKFRSKKDTIDGYKRIKLIDALSIRGSYDIFKDSMKLSDITINMRISPVQWLGINAGTVLSPYDWVDSTGRVTKDFAINKRNQLGRITRYNVSTTLTLTSKKSRKLMEESVDILSKNWNADYEYFVLHPDQIINFNIPWKVSFSHIISFSRNQNKTKQNSEEWRKIHTISMNGDVSFTKRWKLTATISMDLNTKKLINTRFSLKRNMHCWALSFDWIPIGGNKSFLLSIRNTSSLFQSAPLNFRRLPTFL